MELFQGRACRLPTEVIQEGVGRKTWEGELAMVAVPGSMPEKFYFSVRDDVVAAQINQAMGRRMVLYYEQHVGVPTSCFGETEYFVKSVKAIE